MHRTIYRAFIAMGHGGCDQSGCAASPPPASGVVAPAVPPAAKEKSTTDHSQLEALKGPFKSGPRSPRPA
jgi:hypothetical protein